MKIYFLIFILINHYTTGLQEKNNLQYQISYPLWFQTKVPFPSTLTQHQVCHLAPCKYKFKHKNETAHFRACSEYSLTPTTHNSPSNIISGCPQATQGNGTFIFIVKLY